MGRIGGRMLGGTKRGTLGAGSQEKKGSWT